MAPTFRSIGLRPGGRRYLGSERELRLGVYFWFRLFNVAPETTARFSYLDDQSRDQSPPGVISLFMLNVARQPSQRTADLRVGPGGSDHFMLLARCADQR